MKATNGDCRYLCQFRRWAGNFYVSDRCFRRLSNARRYVDRVISERNDLAEARVLDQETESYVYYTA